MKKKNVKLDGMPISEFVEYFLGTQHSCSKLKHEGLKSFDNPYLIGVSNDFAIKNPDCVYRQEVIVVIDDYKMPGTYVNPHNLKMLTELEICKYQLKEIEKITLHDLRDIDVLYRACNDLILKIMSLEALYGKTYDLLRYMRKGRVIRDIRNSAKLEAEKTLRLIELPEKKRVEEKQKYKEYDDMSSFLHECNYEPEEEYEVTEKVNRCKKLGIR